MLVTTKKTLGSEAEREAFQDIRDYMARAMRFVDGFDLDAFRADEKTFYAVARCVEIMDEVSKRLPSTFEFPEIWEDDDCPFSDVEYFEFFRLEDAPRLWRVIHEGFPSISAAVDAELQA